MINRYAAKYKEMRIKILEELGLAQVSILEKNGQMRQWKPQSIEDAAYYVEREIAEIEDLLMNSTQRIADLVSQQVGAQGIVLPGDRPKLTVPSGGPSDTDLRQKQSELTTKLTALQEAISA